MEKIEMRAPRAVRGKKQDHVQAFMYVCIISFTKSSILNLPYLDEVHRPVDCPEVNVQLLRQIKTQCPELALSTWEDNIQGKSFLLCRSLSLVPYV